MPAEGTRGEVPPPQPQESSGRALTLGVLTMYVGGVSQLLFVTGQGFGSVLSMAVLPFIAGDVTKVLTALVLLRGVAPKSPGLR